jgi:hypothetical protein
MPRLTPAFCSVQIGWIGSTVRKLVAWYFAHELGPLVPSGIQGHSIYESEGRTFESFRARQISYRSE